jgi:hypothetical protein
METSPKKDVYELIAELVNTSEELHNKDVEVVLSAPESIEPEVQPSPEEAPVNSISLKEEPQKQSGTGNIRILDKGFVNLTRMVQEQKELISQLTDKIHEFETEVEKEGIQKQKQPIDIEDLKAEIQDFATRQNGQFHLRIKTTEGLILTQLQLLNSRDQHREQAYLPNWLMWVNFAFLGLVSILLSVVLYNQYQLQNRQNIIPLPSQAEENQKPAAPALSDMQFPTESLQEGSQPDEIVTSVASQEEKEVVQNVQTTPAKNVIAQSNQTEKTSVPAVASNNKIVPVVSNENKLSRNDSAKNVSDVVFDED